MTAADGDTAARRQRGRTSALWRWSLIERAMDDALTSRQRGAIVRDLAGREHAGPWGSTVPGSRKTIDRWITARRAGGVDALVPAPRQSSPRTDPQVGELAVRPAEGKPGPPAPLYADNGGWFTDASLARTGAVLGIKLVHSQPGKPAGRGKIEKVFQTIQQQFLVEVTAGDDPARHPVASLEELNDLLDHWIREVYHQRAHSETGASPQARYQAAGPAAPPDPALLREAFCWSAVRLGRQTATLRLEGNEYSGDPVLVGRKV